MINLSDACKIYIVKISSVSTCTNRAHNTDPSSRIDHARTFWHRFFPLFPSSLSPISHHGHEMQEAFGGCADIGRPLPRELNFETRYLFFHIFHIRVFQYEYFNFYLIPDNSTERIETSRAGLDHWKSNKYYRAIQLMQSLLILLVLCFAAFLIYLSASGNAFQNIHQTS